MRFSWFKNTSKNVLYNSLLKALQQKLKKIMVREYELEEGLKKILKKWNRMSF